MRMKEYNAYMAKRNLILQKLDDMNIEEQILNYLENQDINVEDKNISVLVRMIKRIIFDFNMYGKDATTNMIKDNDNYLFSCFNGKDNVSIEQLKTNVNITLRKNKITEDINNFIVSTADAVNQSFNRQQQKNTNKYIYVAQ